MKNGKGYIAICAHFHQPHFQLYKIREQVYDNSYTEWLNALQDWVEMNGFYINIHFSGPFLYWIKREKPEMTEKLVRLYKSKKIGLIGGMADEAFVQLSTKRSDILFQMREYAELIGSVFSIKQKEWQGIHIPERESGEYLLDGINIAAMEMGAPAIYYLDSETYYKKHFSIPGSKHDFCKEFFGFDDCVSRTTYSHLPDELLYYGLRDEIAGSSFICLPLHKEFRYKFLKNSLFNKYDGTSVSPEQYFEIVKSTLRRARELSERSGKILEPIVTIFEDAEKLGDWSKNADADKAWLTRFIELVIADPETEFIGLKDYIDRVGYFDTYPVALSAAYPEWENWTAKRGIRGITFGDERLRRSVSRLRLLEGEQREVEKAVLDRMALPNGNWFKRLLLDSVYCFDFVLDCLKRTKCDADVYYLINRVRNIVYQEDSKWASRHPNYGSSPYFDSIGFAYIELAQRAFWKLSSELNANSRKTVCMRDWDGDGEKEAVVLTDAVTAVVDPRGGCVSYLYALREDVKGADNCKLLLSRELLELGGYTSIYRYVMPLVMTETDSGLAVKFSSDGERLERCRNSFRCKILNKVDSHYECICDADNAVYSLEAIDTRNTATVSARAKFDTQYGVLEIVKKFSFDGDRIIVEIGADIDSKEDLYLVPEIVCAATASDEKTLKPHADIGFYDGGNTCVRVRRSCGEKNMFDVCAYDRRVDRIVYSYDVHSGNGDFFTNKIAYMLDTNEDIPELVVKPAVEHFYNGYVHSDQSTLGYATSGIALLPHIRLNGGHASVKIAVESFVEQDESMEKTELMD